MVLAAFLARALGRGDQARIRDSGRSTESRLRMRRVAPASRNRPRRAHGRGRGSGSRGEQPDPGDADRGEPSSAPQREPQVAVGVLREGPNRRRALSPVDDPSPDPPGPQAGRTSRIRLSEEGLRPLVRDDRRRDQRTARRATREEAHLPRGREGGGRDGRAELADRRAMTTSRSSAQSSFHRAQSELWLARRSCPTW